MKVKTRTSLHIQVRVVVVVLAAISLNCARIKTTVVEEGRVQRREEIPQRTERPEMRVAVEGDERNVVIRLSAQNQCGTKVQDVHELVEVTKREGAGETIAVNLMLAAISIGMGEGLTALLSSRTQQAAAEGEPVPDDGTGRLITRLGFDLVGAVFAVAAVVDAVRQMDSDRSLGTYTTEVSRHMYPCDLRPLPQTAVTLSFPRSPDLLLNTSDDGTASFPATQLTTNTLALKELHGTAHISPENETLSFELPDNVLRALRTGRAERLVKDGLEKVEAGLLSDARTIMRSVNALGGDPTSLRDTLLAAEKTRAELLVAQAREDIEAVRFENAWKKILDAEELGLDAQDVRAALSAAKLRMGEAKAKDAIILVRQGKLDDAVRAMEEAEAFNVDTNAARTLIAEAEWKRSGRGMSIDALRAFVLRHGVATPNDARRRLEALEAREEERARREAERLRREGQTPLTAYQAANLRVDDRVCPEGKLVGYIVATLKGNEYEVADGTAIWPHGEAVIETRFRTRLLLTMKKGLFSSKGAFAECIRVPAVSNGTPDWRTRNVSTVSGFAERWPVLEQDLRSHLGADGKPTTCRLVNTGGLIQDICQ